TALGNNTLSAITTGDYNSAAGSLALSVSTGSGNTAVGYESLWQNVTGDSNTAVGSDSLQSNVSGSQNTVIGRTAGSVLGQVQTATAIVSGVNYTIQTLGTTDFTLIGASSNTVGGTFTATGAGSGTGTASANAKYNTFIGHQAGDVIVGGSKNSILGRFDGNQGGLDIRNSDNNIVLSDGDGNPRLQIDGSGNVDIINTSDLTVDMKSPGDVTLTLDADTDNSDEGDVPTIILKQDAGITEMRMGLNGSTDQVYTGIAANMGYIGAKEGMQVAVDFTNTPFPVAQFDGTGDITFLTAANAQQFKFDYSSGYLGLGLEGSTNPASLLQINAATATADDASMVRFSTQAGGAFRFHVDNYSASSPTWSVETGGSEALKIKPGGSIGFQPNANASDVVNFSTTQILFNTADLEVLGAAAALTISNTTETAGKLIINDSADENQNLTLAYDAQLEDGYISVDGVTHIYFKEDGNTYFGAGGGATSAPYYDAGNSTEIFPQVAINSTDAGAKNDGTFGVFSWGAGGNVEPEIVLGHSMSGVIGNNSTALVEGNNLGRMLWNGSDGTKMANGVFMFAEAAGTWTSSTAPSNLIIGIEKDDGSYSSNMFSHDGYLGISDANRWATGGNNPSSLLHLYGTAAMITVDIIGENEGGIRFRDGDAGDPDSQSAAIKFDSGSAVSNNALSFYNNDEANLAMRIYNNGAVAHPAQPAFHAITTANENPMVNGDITFNSEILDKNADYSTSNGRFTAPVPGVYTFTAVLVFVNGDGVDDSMTMEFEVNGSNYATVRNDPNVWSNPGEEIPFSMSCVVDLAAGDYVTVALAGVATTRPCTLQEPSHFMGHLI
ncbi:MAG: hypothetical protein HOJ88_09125, partial [Proteobacteria bacterium]|nr:hypothetical protein [Pseudomonadota bacterium]